MGLRYHDHKLYVPTVDGEVTGTPDNTTVFLHSYEFRGVDHIFVKTSEDDTTTYGSYIFRVISDYMMDRFDNLVRTMQEDEYPILAMPEVQECDMNAFQKNVDNFIGYVSLTDLETPWELGDE